MTNFGTPTIAHIDCPACGHPIPIRATAEQLPVNGRLPITLDTSAIGRHVDEAHRSPTTPEPEEPTR